MDYFEIVKLAGAFLAALIASRSIWAGVRNWYMNGWGSRRVWRKKLNLLANWVTDDYVKDLLGTPVFRNQGNVAGIAKPSATIWIDRIYATPHAFVVTRSINERVEAWSVTIYDPRFWWELEVVTSMNIRGRLGRASFDTLSVKPKGRFEQRGAHNYEYVEHSDFGNPGGYQEFALMYATSGVGTSHPSGHDIVLAGSFNDGRETHNQFDHPASPETRSKTIVNTIVVTAPSFDFKRLAKHGWPVAHREQTRLLHQYRRPRQSLWKRLSDRRLFARRISQP